MVEKGSTTRGWIPNSSERTRTMIPHEERPSNEFDADAADDAPHLSPSEFSKKAGISLSTVQRYLDDGKLPKFQPGGPGCRVGIPRSALQAWCASTSTSATQDKTKSADVADDSHSSNTDAHRHHGRAPRWMARR